MALAHGVYLHHWYTENMQTITPNLWFDSEAAEAAEFYTSIFPNSKIIDTSYYMTDTPSDKPKGSVLTVAFELNGQPFLALNGGPMYKFNEAISFTITCKDQEEIDHYWQSLSEIPEAERCGWLKDKYGVSWQVIPANMGELITSEAAMKAMLQMKKIIIADLEAAVS